MKDNADLVHGRLRKAESDRLALDVTLRAGALEPACFHAQQAAEKYLKAFLAHKETGFPYTHNRTKLVLGDIIDRHNVYWGYATCNPH